MITTTLVHKINEDRVALVEISHAKTDEVWLQDTASVFWYYHGLACEELHPHKNVMVVVYDPKKERTKRTDYHCANCGEFLKSLK